MNDNIIFHDIYDYYDKPFINTLTFKVLIILSIVSIAALVVYLIRRKRKKVLSSWQWALQEIAKLNINTCKNKKDFKKFYFALTGIIKQYLYKRYSWKTTDKTDDELIIYLKEQHFEAQQLSSLQKMLEGAVWIKFADEDIIKTQAEKDILIAKQLIESTMPQESPLT